MIQFSEEGKRTLRAVDLFCGGGGSTTGAIRAGCQVVYALNHWPVAIDTHSTNFPEVKHRCAPIDRVDPWRDVPECDLLMASPECTHHSIARGGRPVEDQRRITGWDTVRWIEALRPKWAVIENVREIRDWGPIGKNGRPLKSKKGETFVAWIKAIESLGYHVEFRILNAADYGAATKRLRFFAICRRGHSQQPIPWPDTTHTKSNWRPAWEIIDWNKPCESIFARKRPLAEKTLRRIEIGLRKFVEPFVVKFRNNEAAESIHAPLSTVTTSGAHHGLALPFMIKYHGGRAAGRDGTERQYSLLDPLPTLDTSNRCGIAMPFLVDRNWGENREGRNRVHIVTGPLSTITGIAGQAVAVPFLVPNFGERDGQVPRTHSLEDPLPAATSHGAGQLAMPFLLDVHNQRRDDNTQSAGEPLPTIVTKPGNSIALPFITEYYGTASARAIGEPLSTVTTKHRHGLAMVKLVETCDELGIADIGFRMLQPDELSRAQGFGEDYYWHGSKEEQVKQIGNAVCPDVMEAICRALLEAS